MASGEGRVWLGGGKHFVLMSGYDKTWLFDTASLSAVWMENEIKKIKEGTSTQLTTVPLPLEHPEHDASQEPPPALPGVPGENSPAAQEEHDKTADTAGAAMVTIEPAPRGDLLAVRLPNGGQKDANPAAMCYVLQIETGPKGEMFLSVQKKIEFARGESFFWTADGRGLLFGAGDKFRLESIPLFSIF